MAEQSADTGQAGRADLSSTAYAVMAILSVNDEELSVGEIKRRATFGMQLFYWAPAVSHIRREMGKLLSLGLVDKREISTGGARTAQIYHVTKSGRTALAQWVENNAKDASVIVKNSMLLRVFLGGMVTPEVVLAIVDSRIDEVARAIEDLQWARRRSAELGVDEKGELRFPFAVMDYNMRALYFEHANLRQLRDTIVGFDIESFHQDDRKPRGTFRRRGHPDDEA